MNRNLETRELVASVLPGGLVPARPAPTLEADCSAPAQQLSLSAYYHVLLKRRWTVLTLTISLTTIVAIVSFKTTPVYRAYARVQVEAETPLISSLNEMLQKSDADDAFLQTQIQLLKSENLAWRTVEQLGLTQNLIPPDTLDKIPPESRQARLIQAFKGKLSVELVPKTRMLVVGFENTNPRLAAEVATSLVANYIDYNFRQKYDATRQASGWMEQQLDELKAKVEKSQQALVEYERQNQIVNTNEKQNVLEQVLSDQSRDMTNAQSERFQKESVYSEVLKNRSRTAVLAHDDLLQKLEERAADLKGQYTDASGQYGPMFPKVLRLQQQIDDNQAQIEREQNRVVERIRKDYDAAVNREKLAEAAVAVQKERVGKLNQLLVQHNLLQREFESNQQLYQNLLQRLKDATVSAGLRSTNIHLVDKALPPLRPVRPRKLLNIAMGFLTGAILGMMAAFAQEGLDHSVKTAEEVEALLSTATLAVIPLDRDSWQERASLLTKMGRGQTTGASRSREVVALTITNRPQSVLAEAYRALRTAILLSVAPQAPKVLLVASTSTGEGKTATALNLAQALAQQKGPVVICDCDLRKGSIARVLGIKSDKGLSTVLTGADLLEDVLQPCAAQPDLWVLPSGPVPPNPAELLASDAMAAVCEKLAARFEHTVMDSPPVLAVTDATVLAHLVDGVVLVAESGRTARGALLRTRSILENSGARILGVVLNKLDLRQQGYYGSYGHYYYYRYYPKYPYGGE